MQHLLFSTLRSVKWIVLKLDVWWTYLTNFILRSVKFLLQSVKVWLSLVQLRLSLFSLNLVFASGSLEKKGQRNVIKFLEFSQSKTLKLLGLATHICVIIIFYLNTNLKTGIKNTNIFQIKDPNFILSLLEKVVCNLYFTFRFKILVCIEKSECIVYIDCQT